MLKMDNGRVLDYDFSNVITRPMNEADPLHYLFSFTGENS